MRISPLVDKRRTAPNDGRSDAHHRSCRRKEHRHLRRHDRYCRHAGEYSQALARKKRGKIFACATHGILSGPAIERLRNAPIEEIILTNSVPLDSSRILPNMTILSVAGLLGTAIHSIHEETSVSNLFV